MSSIAHRGFVDLGMDVSKNSIAVAVLPPDRDVAEVDKIFHDTDSVHRLIKRVGPPKGIWACYEAGPTGYDLQRLLLDGSQVPTWWPHPSSRKARVIGSRPIGGMPGGWRGCTGPAS